MSFWVHDHDASCRCGAGKHNLNIHLGRRDQELKISLLMAPSNIPQRSKAIVLRKAEDPNGLYKFDAVLEDRDVPPLKDGQVLVKIEAAGFNHREVSCDTHSFAQLSSIFLGLDPERSVPGYNHWEYLRRGRSRCGRRMI